MVKVNVPSDKPLSQTLKIFQKLSAQQRAVARMKRFFLTKKAKRAFKQQRSTRFQKIMKNNFIRVSKNNRKRLIEKQKMIQEKRDLKAKQDLEQKE